MWSQLIVALIMMVVSTALQSAATPRVKQADTEPGKLDIPSPDEGKSIPVVFGTCIIKDANVAWYGDPSTTPIKQSSGSGGKK